jgi:hypothetical protein
MADHPEVTVLLLWGVWAVRNTRSKTHRMLGLPLLFAAAVSLSVTITVPP